MRKRDGYFLEIKKADRMAINRSAPLSKTNSPSILINIMHVLHERERPSFLPYEIIWFEGQVLQ